MMSSRSYISALLLVATASVFAADTFEHILSEVSEVAQQTTEVAAQAAPFVAPVVTEVAATAAVVAPVAATVAPAAPVVTEGAKQVAAASKWMAPFNMIKTGYNKGLQLVVNFHNPANHSMTTIVAADITAAFAITALLAGTEWKYQPVRSSFRWVKKQAGEHTTGAIVVGGLGVSAIGYLMYRYNMIPMTQISSVASKLMSFVGDKTVMAAGYALALTVGYVAHKYDAFGKAKTAGQWALDTVSNHKFATAVSTLALGAVSVAAYKGYIPTKWVKDLYNLAKQNKATTALATTVAAGAAYEAYNHRAVIASYLTWTTAVYDKTFGKLFAKTQPAPATATPPAATTPSTTGSSVQDQAKNAAGLTKRTVSFGSRAGAAGKQQ